METTNEILVYEKLVRATLKVAIKKALIQDFANRLRRLTKERALGMLRSGSCRECRYRINEEYAFSQDPALIPISYCALKTTSSWKFSKYERGEIYDLGHSCKYFWKQLERWHNATGQWTTRQPGRY